MRLLLSLALLLATTNAATSKSYIARNGMLVHASGPNHIVVPMSGAAGNTDFWCAAGDYVRSILRVPNKQILYRLSEPPRAKGQPIVFSLSPDGAATSTGVTVFGGPGGGGMTVGLATGFCGAQLWSVPRN